MCLGQVLLTAPPSHQPQFAPCDQMSGVFNLCKECDAACSRDLGYDICYSPKCIRQNDQAMIHWICNVKAKDEVSSDTLLSKLGIQDWDVVLHTSRMRWFGHVERSTGWKYKVRKLSVVARKRPSRPKKTWGEVTERSLEWIWLTLRTVLSGKNFSEEDLSNKSNPR